MQGTRVRIRRWLTAAALVTIVAGPAPGFAFSGGLPSTVFDLTGCALCHDGGTEPVVVLSGPTAVDPGDSADFTLTIFGNPLQAHGGLNVTASDGTLATGGAFAAGTKTIAGLAGLAEITHSAPKQGDFTNIIEFSFRWTAPADFAGSATLTGWGAAVNLDLLTTGDRAARATLVVDSTGPAPTPTATPLPKPDYCTDVAPLDPPLIGDAAALACQRAIAKGGALYAKKSLKAVQTCLKRVQADGPAGDALAHCAGDALAMLPPTDAKTAAALAKVDDKVRRFLIAKCSDDAVAALPLCADTATGTADCVLAAHRLALATALQAQYGALQPALDPAVRKCQSAIGGNAARYLATHLKAAQKCLLARSKAGTPGSGAALCLGAVAGGSAIPPADARTADQIAAAADKLVEKLARTCDEVDVAALDACGTTRAALNECLICASRRTAFDLLGSQFGGS